MGIYGVIAFSVRQRTREIGLRLAVGADQPKILGEVLKTGLKLAAIGALIGSVGAVLAGRTLRTFLYEVEAGDPITYVAVAGVLTVATVAACLVPAVRASRIDPATALRSE